MRKSYGNTYWGKEWLQSLTQIDYSNRLPRGKTYANKGLAKDIEIKENRITAKVQGSRRRPYDVSVSVANFTATEKAKIIQLVTENPIHLSKLLNRELPSQLDEACKRVGIHIFPNSWRDMNGRCSCPDSAVPCKHLASVLYLIANEIDKNPFLVFELHGFDLFKGLEGVGYTIGEQKEISILQVSDLQTEYHFDETVFEWQDAIFQQLDFSNIPNCKTQLLTLLGNKPVFYPSGDFKAILEKGYQSVAKYLTKKAKKKEIETLTSEMDAVDEIEILLTAEQYFLQANFRDSRGKTIISFEEEEKLMAWLEEIPMARLEQLAPCLAGLFLTYFLAEKLAIQSAFIPQLLRVGTKRYRIRWLPAILNETVRAIYEQVKALTPKNLVFYKIGKGIQQPIESDAYPTLVSFFLSFLMERYRDLKKVRNQENEVFQIFFNGALEQFTQFENQTYPSAIQLWLNKFYIAEKDFVPVLQVEDIEDVGFEVKIALQDTTQPLEPLISLKDVFAKKSYSAIRLDFLRDLAMMSDFFPQISYLVASKGAEQLVFDSNDFVAILFKILPTIKLFGIKILLPKALRKLLRPKMSMQLESEDDGTIQGKQSIINMDEMLSFEWKIAIGDRLVTEKEFLQLVRQFSGIVKLNDEFVFFDENDIRSLIDKIENPPHVDGHQLLQIALTEDYEGAKVHLDKNTRQLIDRLLTGEGTETPEGLQATLRPYQLRGYEWLYKNSRLGFGSLIADDMGLGKTLQVIATLLKLKEDGELETHKALIVVPTTLLTNWEKEIRKFAPALKTHTYHGPNRDLKPLREADALITTYGVARTETTKLNKQKWLTLIIDEAQAIKNPGTAQTKAIKKLKAPVKIAMSGTPVENRLSEYWSIFDFSNKGYLGNLKKFKEDFAAPIEIEKDQVQLAKFRKVTEPFILRRLKSDKSIIKDLPDKIELDQYCQLSPEQTALYQSVVETTMKAVAAADGIQRKGQILKLITALKQVCNHPRQFLKKGPADPTVSGKCALLFSLLKQILDKNEKVLIFTQYQEMGRMLAQMIEAEFGAIAPFLHGGVSRKGRDEMVEDLQNNRTTRIMILSLKAGGTGLNLTAASNVIHYDLWWNPAVEAQATDRAYRIGQNRNVMVHRFITKGTFEEKINQLLVSKRELANMTVSTGEKWIGDLSNAELSEMMRLES
ncbi:MAG: SNF2-related protein [Saprospiraceae bacterium]